MYGMTRNIIIVGFLSLSQAIAFYLTFRLRARGRVHDLIRSLCKELRKSSPLKTVKEQRACDCVASANKKKNGGIINQARVVQTMDSAIHRINHYPVDKH